MRVWTSRERTRFEKSRSAHLIWHGPEQFGTCTTTGKTTMLYNLYEWQRTAAAPIWNAADWCQWTFRNPYNPMSYAAPGQTIAASCDFLEKVTRRYSKPKFNLTETEVDGSKVCVREQVVWRKPFASLKRFVRDFGAESRPADPKLLIVAPMSGHYATLLRGTVEAMLPAHDVYITDWVNARTVPLSSGQFDLHDYIDYVIDMIRTIGPNTHVMAVCQPGPAVLSAASLMAEVGDPSGPASMIIMGSPIDARRSPTIPNELAESRPLSWFEQNLVHTVPWPYPGVFRRVYPGFLQLGSFIAMNPDRHVRSFQDYFNNLVKGDGESAEKHREFYDEYLAVMDLSAEYYLQTVDVVFQRHLLAKGKFSHRGQLVNPGAITKTALMTIEGENDDISGIGQTQAAHDLVINISDNKRLDHVQPDVGHYGVFSGRRFRDEIQPCIQKFIRQADLDR